MPGIIGSKAGNEMLSAGAFLCDDRGTASRPITRLPIKLAVMTDMSSLSVSSVLVPWPAAASRAQSEKFLTGTLLILPKPMAAIAAKMQSSKMYVILMFVYMMLMFIINKQRYNPADRQMVVVEAVMNRLMAQMW